LLNECEEDSDGDRVADACDGCPTDPDKVEPGICGCNLLDTANGDDDRVPDCVDICPGLADALFAPECGPVIPTVSAWGLLSVALALLIIAKVSFGGQRERAISLG
jgi:hypothetical protein